MIVHLMLIKPKTDVAPELEQRILEGLQGMRGSAPGIPDIDCGISIDSGRSRGYRLGFSALFPHQEALEAFELSAEYVRIEELVHEYADDWLVMNFTTPPRSGISAYFLQRVAAGLGGFQVTDEEAGLLSTAYQAFDPNLSSVAAGDLMKREPQLWFRALRGSGERLP